MANESNPPSSPLRRRAAHGSIWLGLIALAAYAVLIGARATVAAGGSDSSGYLNSARLLASGRLESPVRIPAEVAGNQGISPPSFQPLGFVAFENDTRLVPTYPTGFPLHVALAAKLFGWSNGIRIVEILGALAGLCLCYAVGRELGLDRVLAAAATVVLAACPVMLFAAIQPLSDMLAMTWCLAAVWAALRTRRQPGWSIACGAAYGMAVLVRPTNILLLPALLVILGLNWRRLALAVVGAIPCVAWLAFYNHSIYGGALRSGYFNWSEFFALRYFVPAGSYFLRWLAVFLPAILLVLPFAALFRRETRTRELAALACWFVPLVGLYMFVSFSHEAWTCLRYLLPAIPALIFAAMLGVETLARTFEARLTAAPSMRWFRPAAAILLATWAVVMSWQWSRQSALWLIKGYEDAYISATAAAQAKFPANTLVLSCHMSGALFFYTDFSVLRWDALTPAEFKRYVAWATRAGVTLGAVLFNGEEEGALRQSCPGEWERVATVGNVGIWRLAPGSVP
jgi:4-amino-4-deoxy-L-arabinose transferase-like glycosyltransferase